MMCATPGDLRNWTMKCSMAAPSESGRGNHGIRHTRQTDWGSCLRFARLRGRRIGAQGTGPVTREGSSNPGKEWLAPRLAVHIPLDAVSTSMLSFLAAAPFAPLVGRRGAITTHSMGEHVHCIVTEELSDED